MKTPILIGILISFMLWIVSGCGSNFGFDINNLQMDKAYSFNAQINYNEMSAAAYFERFSQGRWNVNLTEPYELQGISLYFKDDMAKATFAGITVDLSHLPEISTIAEKLIDTLENAIASEGTQAIRAGDTIEIMGMTQFGGYKLVLDSKTKLPVSVVVPDNNLRITFSNVKTAEVTGPEVIDVS
ncbi:MAG: hypothetical protein FWH05_01170 [Oscillospiraceae bacterium]|nr:hypothetical protein [Oscillospiraceae bacterium]